MRRQPTTKPGFTLIELLVVISIIALLLGILVPVLGIAKKNASLMKESVNIRNLNLALNTYAVTNKDWFPGLNSSGRYGTSNFSGEYYYAEQTITSPLTGAGATVDSNNNTALAILLEEGHMVPAQLVSPGETGANSYTPPFAFGPAVPDEVRASAATASSGAVTHVHFSYSLLQYGAISLKSEWKSNQNQQAVIAGARLIFNDGAGSAPTSLALGNPPGGLAAMGQASSESAPAGTLAFNCLWTDALGGKYKGAIVRGDSSTNTEAFSLADLRATPTYFTHLKYGVTVINPGSGPSSAGVFGLSNHGLNGAESYGATSALGQLGSTND